MQDCFLRFFRILFFLLQISERPKNNQTKQHNPSCTTQEPTKDLHLNLTGLD